MNTFQYELSYLSKVANTGEDGNTIIWVNQKVKKTAKFFELDQLDKKQHKLHFQIQALIEGIFLNGDYKEGDIPKIPSDELYDISEKAFNTLLIPGEGSINEQEKTEFLADSGAIKRFGKKFFSEKLLPFFLEFNKD